METLAKSDLFFFVTAVVVVLWGLLASVALIYFIKVLKNIKDVTDAIHDEAGDLIEDIDNLRIDMRDKVTKASNILAVITTARFLKTLFGGKKDTKDK